MTEELVARFQKRFGSTTLIDVDFHQATTGFSVTALVGPSGCGKTTLLRCLAGLCRPDHGTIQFQNHTWFDSSRQVFLPPQQREIGFLFQEYALFPHLNVAENIGFGLRNLSPVERHQKVTEILDRFELTGFEARLPRQLSGGQQQRVALGRVLVRRPRLLLLDEPLSALDAHLREHMCAQLRQILVDFAIPVIVVTHDRVEASALADRVAVMEQGRIRQMGSVNEVFASNGR